MFFLPHPVVLVGLLDTCSNPSVGILLTLVSNQVVFLNSYSFYGPYCIEPLKEEMENIPQFGSFLNMKP